jgi:ArsR family transcriptional regulator
MLNMRILNKSVTTEISQSEAKLVQAMQLLGDQTRFKIFKLLMTKQDLCVTDIAEKLEVTASAISQHFRQFELVGLVNKQRVGQKICYMLDEENDLVRNLMKITRKQFN